MKRIFFVVLAVCIGGVMLSGCTSGCMKKTEKVNEYKITLGSHSAVTPLSRPDEWWTKRHQAVVDRVKQGNVDLIFIGDSITHFWDAAGFWKDTGKEVWDKYYAKRNAVNMGFSGDRTQNVLWRLDNGEITGISPKLAIIMIGTNNSAGNENTAKEIGEGIIAICQKLRKDLPNTKILLLAIFPAFEKPCPQRAKNAEASKLVSTIADNKWIYYMDIKDKFLNKDGTLSKEIMPDFAHPNAKGYQIEAEAIEPMVEKLMGEKK
jgi:lysophospholipase L1-like esterase